MGLEWSNDSKETISELPTASDKKWAWALSYWYEDDFLFSIFYFYFYSHSNKRRYHEKKKVLS